MAGCAAVVTVPAVPAVVAVVADPAVVADATVPTTFDPWIFEIADPFEAIRSPWTLRPVRVPTLVMAGCAATVTVPAVVAVVADPAVVADATVPTTFDP
jgi:hypothetical protein